MKKSVCFNYNFLLKTAGGAMPIFDYVKPCQERSGPR
jgi:hypothetical protein